MHVTIGLEPKGHSRALPGTVHMSSITSVCKVSVTSGSQFKEQSMNM